MEKPLYTLTPEILRLLTAISEQLGAIKSRQQESVTPQLRRRNRIRTIRASLQIEGNTLNEAQITAVLEGKRVLGPPKDIREVENALAAYEQLSEFSPFEESHFLEAHALLMRGLVDDFGQYRAGNVGILQGDQLAHLAPPSWNVPHLMGNLFSYLCESEDLPLLKSCVFHYEMEFIHPFTDGNGRMGRLWQSLLLQEVHPLFGQIPLETLVSQNQNAYYEALAACDRAGESTLFIQFMLRIILQALEAYSEEQQQPHNTETRLAYFVSLGQSPFSRKDYLAVFPKISSATASRDLRAGLLQGLFTKEGDKRNTRYHLIENI